MLRFELSEQMVAVIFKSLGDSTFRDVAHVVYELQRQIDAQRPRIEMPQPHAGNGTERHVGE
jgi:hypothetical protein